MQARRGRRACADPSARKPWRNSRYRIYLDRRSDAMRRQAGGRERYEVRALMRLSRSYRAGAAARAFAHARSRTENAIYARRRGTDDRGGSGARKLSTRNDTSPPVAVACRKLREKSPSFSRSDESSSWVSLPDPEDLSRRDDKSRARAVARVWVARVRRDMSYNE